MENIERIEQQLKEQREINEQLVSQLLVQLDQINLIQKELIYIKIHSKNLKYEVLGMAQNKDEVFIPKFRDISETIEDIVVHRKSLARFGDADFGILFQREREGIKYQSLNARLSGRLREVLHSRHPRLLVGIADNYGSLDKYTEVSAYNIRTYMTEPGIRNAHEEVLERDRVYEDAYISRPYVMYKDNNTDGPQKRFEALRRIWANRKIIIVEGCQTRMGIGNDLLEGAEDVKRILAPAINAFDKYEDILKTALAYAEKDTLFLIVLGATASVLAYDLTVLGYQAVDIGQTDIEYEWFLAGKGERVPVPYKFNNEVDGGEYVAEFHDMAYEKQILAVIG